MTLAARASELKLLRGRVASPGATRRRQGVERAKTLVIFANSIKTSKAIKYLAIDHTKK